MAAIEFSETMRRAYLARIGMGRKVEPTRDCLDELVYRHQCSVPFETADLVASKRTPDLSVDALFEKIVTDRHGGYCFEMNKLFECLLRTCGFDARPCLSRAVRGRREGRMAINHRGTLVQVEGELLSVDVGFGGPLPAGSLVLSDELEQNVRGEIYIPRRIDEHWWAIDRISQSKRDLYGDEGPSQRQTELELCLAKVDEMDFDALNLACSQPGTLFCDTVLANIRTERGFKSLTGNVLNIREGDARQKVELSGADEVRRALEEHFGFAPYGGAR